MKTLNKKQVTEMFRVEVLPSLNQKDVIAVNTAWHQFTDMLCKDGKITLANYQNWMTPSFKSKKKK